MRLTTPLSPHLLVSEEMMIVIILFLCLKKTEAGVHVIVSPGFTYKPSFIACLSMVDDDEAATDSLTSSSRTMCVSLLQMLILTRRVEQLRRRKGLKFIPNLLSFWKSRKAIRKRDHEEDVFQYQQRKDRRRNQYKTYVIIHYSFTCFKE
jgi:hypothetical protein